MNKPTILITGASSGIGRKLAEYFDERGWQVAATMRDPEKGAMLEQKGRQCRVYRLDVTEEDSINEAIAEAMQDFGQIDVLVNNAGYGVNGPFEAMNEEIIHRQFNTNVFGLMRVTRAIIPHLREIGGGTIIQLSSMGGRFSFPLFSLYHATKWAIEGFSESLQYELSTFNIKVKVIEPGAIKTDFFHRNREVVTRDDLQMYTSYVNTINKVSRRAGNQGQDPAIVAQTVERAATDGSFRLRYAVGKPAPFLLRLRRLLPDSLFFRLIRRRIEG